MRNLLEQVAQPQSNNTTVFIYGLIDPRNNYVRYVGKTDNMKRRRREHLSRRDLLPKNPKAQWIKSLLEEGLEPKIIVLEPIDNDAWKDAERKWIALYRSTSGYPELTNRTSGGDGLTTAQRRSRVVLSPTLMPRHNIAQPSDQSIKIIPLTQGQVALVSVKWFDEFSKYNWTASWDKRAKTFYASRRIQIGKKSTTLLMHRIVAGSNYPHVDHKDGNGLNNTDENLRKCTVSQNGGNRKINSNNKSGYKGVHLAKGKYAANIRVKGISYRLGRFDDPRDAAKAYDREAIKRFGEFARTNFPQSDYLS